MSRLERRISSAEMIEAIRDVKPPADGYLAFIAISGFSGSGKSTLANRVSDAVEGCEVVSIDDFIFGPRSQRSSDWSTFDRKRLRKDVLDVAKPGESLSYRCYNSGEWVSGKGGTLRTITPQKLLIIEGCGILNPSLVQYYDYSAWIGCATNVALEQAKARDRSEGNDNDLLWDKIWGPNDRDYFNQFRPDQLAMVTVEPETT